MRKILVVFFVFIVAGALLAGDYTNSEVYIHNYSSGGGWARGAMEPARYSSDSIQYISCSVYSFNYTHCEAKDRTGKVFAGYSTDPKYEEMVKAMTKTSHILFYVDASGKLTQISVVNSSSYIK